MTKQLFDYDIGDELFFVPSDRRERPFKVTITAKGRKYVSLSPRSLRASKNESGGRILGHVHEYPHGSIYAKEEDWIFEQKWQDAHLNLRYKNCSDEQKARILAIIEESNEPYDAYSR